jgi:putative transposase
MDGIVIKIQNNEKVQRKVIYLIIGLRQDGLKEVLGMWISETESGSFWMNVLTDLIVPGFEDILISCTDNLAASGKPLTLFIQILLSYILLCVVHQIVLAHHMLPGKSIKNLLLI